EPISKVLISSLMPAPGSHQFARLCEHWKHVGIPVNGPLSSEVKYCLQRIAKHANGERPGQRLHDLMLEPGAILVLIHEYASVGGLQDAIDGTAADKMGGGFINGIPFAVSLRLNVCEAGSLWERRAVAQAPSGYCIEAEFVASDVVLL